MSTSPTSTTATTTTIVTFDLAVGAERPIA